MKKLLYLSLSLFCAANIFSGCNKNSNNYSVTDHTVGMIKVRSWSGNASGYSIGDTIQFPAPDTTHVPWCKIFNRTVTDTSFTVGKVNGFAVSVLGIVLNYKKTDSTLQTVRFDTTLSGSATTVLLFYYAKDSMSYEYHIITGYNAAENQYYQTNEFLHTNPL